MEPGEIHAHKCGWDPTYPERHGNGCGHVFLHEFPRVEVTTEVYDNGHLCPVCKAGPWRGAWSTEAEAIWASLTPEERDEVVREARREALARAFFFAVFQRVLR